MILMTGCAIDYSSMLNKLPFIDKFSRGASSGEDVIFYGGEEGVYFEIIEPFDEYYSGNDLGVGIEITNKGESNVEQGEACFFGLDKGTFEVSGCDCDTFGPLISKYEKVERGRSHELLSFGPYTFNKDYSFSESQTLSVALYYWYESYAVFEACVRKSLMGDKGCIYKDQEMLKSTSGAPIKVVSVKEKIVPIKNGGDVDSLKLIFDIEIKNNGKGFIIEDMESSCEYAYENLKELDIEIINAPGDAEPCKAIFDDNKDKYIARCEIKDVKPDDYKTDVTIKLDYIYKEIKSKIFKIVVEDD